MVILMVKTGSKSRVSITNGQTNGQYLKLEYCQTNEQELLIMLVMAFFNLPIHFAANLVYLATLHLLSRELIMFIKLKFLKVVSTTFLLVYFFMLKREHL